MREIRASKITETVAELSIRANQVLRNDVLQALKAAYKKENDKRAKKIIEAIIKNALVAKREKLAICQDTGMPVVILEIGQEVRVIGDLKSAVNKGVELGYKKGSLRESIVKDPLVRGSSGYTPALIYTDIIRGNKIKITVLPKGFGCENKSQLKMFKPTVGISEIKKFIIETVKAAGPDACPPFVVGVGIGGSADYAGMLAKRALLKNIGREKLKLEKELLREINKLKIEPMGLGGKCTCLAVNLENYPTHI
ncbi:MAG: fumarate hydratase, partial [Candidatus Omnitrophica bacterium]|nr:fumarate hydratase [Candidatus Omnitrophota bacterium]